MLDYNALKPKDLSHLVDSRIGNPEASSDAQVLNGNFSAGTGTVADNWSVVAGWERVQLIDGSYVYRGTATTAQSFQIPGNIIEGRWYLTKFTIKNYVAGTVRLEIGGALCLNRSGNGTFYQTIQALGTGAINIDGITVFTGDVTDIEIYEYNGEELVPDPDVGFVTNLVTKHNPYGNNTVEQDGNAVKITGVDNAAGSLLYLRNTITGTTFSDLVVGNKYRITYRRKVASGTSINIQIWDGTGMNIESTITDTDYAVKSIDITVNSANPYIIQAGLGAGEILWLEILSVMKITGLVAAYNMIPNGDTLVDISGNGNDGTLDYPIMSEEGLVFDGDADEVDLGTIGTSNPLQLTGAFTVACRVKASISGDQFQRIIDKSDGGNAQNGWSIIMGATGVNGIVSIVINDTSYYTNTNVAFSDKYVNLVFINDGSASYKIYADGVEIESTLTSPWKNAPSVSTNAKIGTWNHSTGREFKGEIADLQIYNYAFSEQQAQDYHSQWAKQVEQRHSFDDLGVGSTI